MLLILSIQFPHHFSTCMKLRLKFKNCNYKLSQSQSIIIKISSLLSAFNILYNNTQYLSNFFTILNTTAFLNCASFQFFTLHYKYNTTTYYYYITCMYYVHGTYIILYLYIYIRTVLQQYAGCETKRSTGLAQGGADSIYHSSLYVQCRFSSIFIASNHWASAWSFCIKKLLIVTVH